MRILIFHRIYCYVYFRTIEYIRSVIGKKADFQIYAIMNNELSSILQSTIPLGLFSCYVCTWYRRNVTISPLFPPLSLFKKFDNQLLLHCERIQSFLSRVETALQKQCTITFSFSPFFFLPLAHYYHFGFFFSPRSYYHSRASPYNDIFSTVS